MGWRLVSTGVLAIPCNGAGMGFWVKIPRKGYGEIGLVRINKEKSDCIISTDFGTVLTLR